MGTRMISRKGATAYAGRAPELSQAWSADEQDVTGAELLSGMNVSTAACFRQKQARAAVAITIVPGATTRPLRYCGLPNLARMLPSFQILNAQTHLGKPGESIWQ